MFILDRREDPITPLLNQWTYQAMIHELIGMDLNKIEPGKIKAQKEQKDEDITFNSDAFYLQNLYSNYGEVATNVKNMMDKFLEKAKSQRKLETIEEMQNFLEHYPEMKTETANVSKHVNIITTINQLVAKDDIFDVSKLEQEIVVNDNEKSQFKVI